MFGRKINEKFIVYVNVILKISSFCDGRGVSYLCVNCSNMYFRNVSSGKIQNITSKIKVITSILSTFTIIIASFWFRRRCYFRNSIFWIRIHRRLIVFIFRIYFFRFLKTNFETNHALMFINWYEKLFYI